eukprot:6189459-Pleurochrysis_carterae.AAC.2
MRQMTDKQSRHKRFRRTSVFGRRSSRHACVCKICVMASNLSDDGFHLSTGELLRVAAATRSTPGTNPAATDKSTASAFAHFGIFAMTSDGMLSVP